MMDYKGQEIEVGDHIAAYKEKWMVEGIVVGFTPKKLNARYKIIGHRHSHRIGQLECTLNPAKTVIIERGTGLPIITDQAALSAVDQLRELL